MANTQQPDSRETRRSQQQTQKQTQRGADQDQGNDRTDRDLDETTRNDHVEVGDPVPEDDRTIRADNRSRDENRGETGEDEDLPEADGIEGTSSERH